MSKISIIDYGIGNILSVKRAFQKVGAEVEYITTEQEIERADHLVLPGVGAFKDGMEELKKRNLVNGIQKFCSENRPFLGICLGMQMMLEESEEFGISKGLGIIPGKVIRIPNTDVNGNPQKVPHVGWNRLKRADKEGSWKRTLLDGMEEDIETYFVHSYVADPVSDEYRLADTYYGGIRLAAVVRKGNCYGTQFHPEKSGEIGLKLIYNFAYTI